MDERRDGSGVEQERSAPSAYIPSVRRVSRPADQLGGDARAGGGRGKIAGIAQPDRRQRPGMDLRLAHGPLGAAASAGTGGQDLARIFRTDFDEFVWDSSANSVGWEFWDHRGDVR